VTLTDHTSTCGLPSEAVWLSTAGTTVLLLGRKLTSSTLTLEGLAPFKT
jgi:hypothetical protein